MGPFSDFLSHDDTYKGMRGQSRSTLIDRRVREDWAASGLTSLNDRALVEARDILETHAVSAAGPAQEAPASRSAVAASLLVSCSVIGKPARSRLPARRRPRLPDAQSRHEKTITSLLPALAGAT